MTEPPAFEDCAVPSGCECRKRGYPKWDHRQCLVPGINAFALKIGWRIPYEVEKLDVLIDTLNRPG